MTLMRFMAGFSAFPRMLSRRAVFTRDCSQRARGGIMNKAAFLLLILFSIKLLAGPGSPDPKKAYDLAIAGEEQTRRGEYDTAEHSLKQSLKLWPREDVPGAIRTAIWLGNLYLETRQYGRTTALRRKLEAFSHDRIAQQDPALAVELWLTIASQHIGTSDVSAAQVWLDRALNLARGISDPVAARLSAILHRLAMIADVNREWQKAESLYREAIATAVNDYDRSNVMLGLAGVLARLGQRAEADGQFAEGLRLLQESYGPDSPLIGYAYTAYANVLQESGRKKEAARLRHEADAALGKSRAAQNNVVDVSEFQAQGRKKERR
jgi:tetratricopeptide (TPR) repeat protein